jgi:SAM-dependent methyltransferase
MEQQLAVALGLMRKSTCLRVLGDGGTDEPGLSAPDVGVRLPELDMTGAQRLDFAAGQGETSLDPLEQLVLVPCTAVLHDQLGSGWMRHGSSLGRRRRPVDYARRSLLTVLASREDAFGHMLSDLFAGRDLVEVVERDDGHIFTGDPSIYLASFRSWWPQERRAMRLVRGRVLDLGCGAGRIGLHLQDRGHEVVGIDVSPLAVEVARRRGLVDARVGTLDTAIEPGERFDTITLLGNNLGLLGGERTGRRILRKLAGCVTNRGRILAGSYDPYEGASELALGYQARNRARGRMGGIERLRIRYRQYATPWYDVLFASRDEVARLAEGTGWVASRFVGEGAGYVAVLDLA